MFDLRLIIYYKDEVQRCYTPEEWVYNCENILANKLTAVIGRDNAKDIFDIYLIDKFYNYDYKEILNIAHQKAGFYDDDLIIRLKTFPLALMKSISLVDDSFLDNFEDEYEIVIEKIEKL